MRDARLLVQALRDPDSLHDPDWSALVATARAEQLIGSLAARLAGKAVPPRVEAILESARRDSAYARTQALWEAEMCRRALAPLGMPAILLKGTAFHAADLDAAEGRSVGDLDILVPRDRIEEAEAALIAAGWERMKAAEGYDDQYYRRWMHELPPLIHHTRDRMIDVHHTILPLTARPRPDATALIADSVVLESGLRMLSPADMIVHAAAHLLADGDLAGGLRNLWDIDRLLREFAARDDDFWRKLAERSRLHQLRGPVALALRLARRLYGTPVDRVVAGRTRLGDRLFEARLLARNGWGQERHKALRFAFYIRSHWLRMPPLMLARHLWVKARA
ncbi:nucleotidyltransferase family protein [Sphingosinicella sp. LHD-64]|uniref:nucleotidyltransferase domain-containing protein n=1 Tax=Sphingosinicella sp. LHD-64 TaxID=3072139 RepID=UPI00280DEF9E|nr:nucleotidyltransferase family protein [Sphingosinicella sp. LHD-64]MDQ8757782.1 nucleotidyltransferase family protein [Sphingosinicella sp. LHD-64]